MERMTRRRLLTRTAALAAGLGILGLGAQCGAPAATPTKVAEKPKVEATPVPAVKGPITVRIQTFGGTGGVYVHEMAKRYEKANPNVKVVPEDTVYMEIPTKTETGFIAGTLQDICYGHNRWYFYGCYKGIYRPLDDLIKASPPPDFADFYPSIIEASKFEGKLYSLPDYTHMGGNIALSFNRGIIKAAGAKEPQPGWTMNDWRELALKCTDKAKGIFGMALSGFTSIHYCLNFTRSWGKPGSQDAWLMAPDGKTFWFDGRPKVKEALGWYLELAHKQRAIPLTADQVEGGLFAAGKLATQAAEGNTPAAFMKQIGDKWPFAAKDAVLLPIGPEGKQGTCYSGNMHMINTKSKVIDEAYKVICLLTSTEAGLYQFKEVGWGHFARHSILTNPDVLKVQPLFAEIDKMSIAGVEQFPMPYNLRFVEVNDVYGQESTHLWEGTKTWDEHASVVQKKVQEKMDLARP